MQGKQLGFFLKHVQDNDISLLKLLYHVEMWKPDLMRLILNNCGLRILNHMSQVTENEEQPG